MDHRDLERIATHWGDEQRRAYYAEGGLMWGQLAAVRARRNRKISGDPERDWIDHLAATHLAARLPVESCLSLCCGTGELERELRERGIVRNCLGVDIAAGCVARAREIAAEQGLDGLQYREADLNRIDLPADAFDLVVAQYALHHLVALEHVLEQVARSLRADGLFVVLDYVGPTREQFEPRTLEIADAVLRLLPDRFVVSVSQRRHGHIGPGSRGGPRGMLRLTWAKLRGGTLTESLLRRAHLKWQSLRGRPHHKRRVPRISAPEVALQDPSEAVRSNEILPLLRERFQIIEEVALGEALLRAVLDDIAGNFEAPDPAADALLEMLFTIEDALMIAEELPSHLMFVVAQRP